MCCCRLPWSECPRYVGEECVGLGPAQVINLTGNDEQMLQGGAGFSKYLGGSEKTGPTLKLRAGD